MALTLMLASPVPAQRLSDGLTLASPVLRLDREQLFKRSLFGQRVVAQLEAAARDLEQQNAKIDAALLAEEKALTDQRPGLSPEAFRDLADAFDEKVVAIRQAQDTKSRDLKGAIETAQNAFFQRVVPVLSQLMREAGALVILDSRTILLSASSIDITDLAIARIDAAIGDGAPAEGAEAGAGAAESGAPEKADPDAQGAGAGGQTGAPSP